MKSSSASNEREADDLEDGDAEGRSSDEPVRTGGGDEEDISESEMVEMLDESLFGPEGMSIDAFILQEQIRRGRTLLNENGEFRWLVHHIRDNYGSHADNDSEENIGCTEAFLAHLIMEDIVEPLLNVAPPKTTLNNILGYINKRVAQGLLSGSDLRDLASRVTDVLESKSVDVCHDKSGEKRNLRNRPVLGQKYS